MKKQKHFKFWGIFITVGLLFCLLSFASILFYNQKRVSAQEADITLCDPEIPIGEAMEETVELLSKISEELYVLDYNAGNEIARAEEMIELTKECDDIKNCKPVCNPTYIFEEELGKKIYICQEKKCQGKFDLGQICPNEKISAKFDEISQVSDNIEISRKEIETLINGKEWVWSWSLQGMGWKTKTEIIQEKLTKSRQIFDNCALSPADWEAVERGEKTEKYPLSCTTVLKNNFPRKEKECKSLYNFFCCH